MNDIVIAAVTKYAWVGIIAGKNWIHIIPIALCVGIGLILGIR